MKLKTYLSKERGRAAKIADALGLSSTSIHEWSVGKKRVPAERCTGIERATDGAVTRRDLRPDDWRLIWPELVTDESPAPGDKEVA